MILNSLTAWFRSRSLDATALAASPARAAASEAKDSGYQSSSHSLDKEVKNASLAARNQVAKSLREVDADTAARLASLNQKRRRQGLQPLDLPKITQALEAIQEDGGLSPKQKKAKIETLRKQLGLGKGEMKKLFTQRLAKAYQDAQRGLERFQQAKTAQLKSELKQAESHYGKGSAQAKAVQSKLQALQSKLQPERQRLAERAGLYRSLYPGFLAKLGGFFKKIGGGLLKVVGVAAAALRLLPGVGPLASRALSSVKYLFQGFRIDKMFGSLGKGLWDTVRNWKNLLPMIPGVGGIASVAANGIAAVLKATRGPAKPL
ncbi:MAG: hypothetical protein U1F66_08550 [bacterium]